jgi:hypothetical protein
LLVQNCGYTTLVVYFVCLVCDDLGFLDRVSAGSQVGLELMILLPRPPAVSAGITGVYPTTSSLALLFFKVP